MAEENQNLPDDFFGPNRDVVTQSGSRIGLPENFADDYYVNLEALRIQQETKPISGL